MLLLTQRLFELHDTDRDGLLLHEEFLAAVRALRKVSALPQDRIQRALSFCIQSNSCVLSNTWILGPKRYCAGHSSDTEL